MCAFVFLAVLVLIIVVLFPRQRRFFGRRVASKKRGAGLKGRVPLYSLTGRERLFTDSGLPYNFFSEGCTGSRNLMRQDQINGVFSCPYPL